MKRFRVRIMGDTALLQEGFVQHVERLDGFSFGRGVRWNKSPFQAKVNSVSTLFI